jgi:RNA polymerase sigma-70 factor (ECF subfamily)
VSDADATLVRATVALVRRGDSDAFGRIVELFQRRLFGLALMMTRDPSGAEEIVQDAFVRAFVNLVSYDDARPFYPWISTITVRLAQNWLVQRRRVNTREGTELDPDLATAVAATDPLTELIMDESDRRLWQSVSALASGERTAVILFYRQDMSVREIASALGVNGGTIKTLLFRARQKLRHTLGDAQTGKDTP